MIGVLCLLVDDVCGGAYLWADAVVSNVEMVHEDHVDVGDCRGIHALVVAVGGSSEKCDEK